MGTMGDDLASNIVPGVRGDSVFDSITRCITFDRKNFGKDISIFERALEHSDRLIHIQKATHGMFRCSMNYLCGIFLLSLSACCSCLHKILPLTNIRV